VGKFCKKLSVLDYKFLSLLYITHISTGLLSLELFLRLQL